MYIAALDMQACGLSSEGAKSLLDVLKYNTTVVVLDVRQNPMIGASHLASCQVRPVLSLLATSRGAVSQGA